MTAKRIATVVLLLCPFLTGQALDRKPGQQLLRGIGQLLNGGDLELSKLKRYSALLNEALSGSATVWNSTSSSTGTAVAATTTVPSNQCPALQVEDAERFNGNSRPIQDALVKATTTLSLTALQTKLRTSLTDQKVFMDVVDFDALVRILQETASHFGAFAVHAQTSLEFKRSHSSNATMAVQALEVLESLSTASANVLNNIAASIQNADKVTVGLLTMSVVSAFRFLDDINLGLTTLLVDYIKAESSFKRVVPNRKLRIRALRNSLSCGFLDPILQFLSKREELSGLDNALQSSTTDLVQLDNRLARFTSSADAMLTKTASTRHSLPNATIETTALLMGTVSTTLNGITGVVTQVFDAVPAMLDVAYGMILFRIMGLNQKTAYTFNAVFDMAKTANDQSSLVDNRAGTSVVSADVIFRIGQALCYALNDSVDCEQKWQIIRFLTLGVLLLPIWLPALAIYLVVFDPEPPEDDDLYPGTCGILFCPFIKAIQCQNDALSDLLPSI